MTRPGLAVSVMPLENRREVFISLATAEDRLGFDGFFLPETWAYDTTVLMAEAALKTERIGLGSGILGVWNRSAATIAMAAATLASISSGRFVLGLGVSTPQLAEGLLRPQLGLDEIALTLEAFRPMLESATGARA